MRAEETCYMQHTLAKPFSCLGVGLHSGYVVTMIVTPSGPNTGYTFVRRDVEKKCNVIKAHWHNVHDAKLSTNLINSQGVKIQSVEHLLAALSAHGIDNARILIDGPEVPSMDGSARPFSDLILSVGKVEQTALRKVMLIKKVVQVCEGDRFLDVQPSPLLWMDLETNLPHAKLGSKRLSTAVTEFSFMQKLCSARNMVNQQQLDNFGELGYYQGLGRTHLLIHDGEEVINRGIQRFKDEGVRHKVIDLLGDLTLADAPIVGHFIGRGADHSLHQLLLLEIMCDPANYVMTTLKDLDAKWMELSAEAGPSRNTAC